MCGIFGVMASSSGGLPVERLQALTRTLFLKSQTRGKDASGVVGVLDADILVHKEARMAAHLLKSPGFSEVLTAASARYSGGGMFVIAGHTRMVTNGTEDNQHNNQPVIKGQVVVLHNGIIVNDEAIWADRPDLTREHQVDTEAFAAMVDRSVDAGEGWPRAMAQAFAACQGANTFAVMHGGENTVLLGTSNGSLYHWSDPTLGLTLFGSEAHILQQALQSLKDLLGSTQGTTPQQVKPTQMLVISLKDGSPRLIPAGAADASAVSDAIPCVPARGIRVLSALAPTHPPGPAVPRHSHAEIERHMVFDTERINALRRCSRCLLPETFPFIRFDGAGVCQFCLQHKPLALRGSDALKQLADRARSANGQQDCLVPISGGRDSCYGLHYVKKELGLNPVAYTYDWGFVTDLARRNTSRMCGALNVEHILVAADIKQKRENVRKNVSAWLHRPTLSMIPLFMAGDKAFFYHASQIQKQMGLGPILFSMNWLEKTGFKTGFAGVNDTGDHEKTYGLGALSQLRLIGHYGMNFLSNPRYINGTIPDTLFGYLSYYLQNKNYHSLFDYLPWSQTTIEDTLIGGYDWETSPDTKSTWRIGDGTAPFYNYIYLTIAGFSEHDTFRSNQIREGMIDRATALREVNEENRPRVESFKWYCETVGIDALAALKAINGAPRLRGVEGR